MLRRPFLTLSLALLALIGVGGWLYAQMEVGDRGILPIESSGTLEINGIHVDVGAKDAQTARYLGWRIAQREGFKQLWAKMHGLPVSQAPNLPDSTLDGLVSSIAVEREQIGPTRYIADLGILFDRARSAQILGIGGEQRHSVPMLLIPVTVTGGTATTVELKNAWQRAWAYFRTADSPIDYVRVSGLGADPLLINAAQMDRPGRGWWRNLLDTYGAADILVAEVQLQRLYPGGPARARFIGRHGPDNEIVGGFTLEARDGDVPKMMAEGVRRMDALFSAALAAGRLERDSTLNLPPPPPAPEEPVEEQVTAATYQVQVYSPDAQTWNFALATLKVMPGVTGANPTSVAIGGVSTLSLTVRGDIGAVRDAMAARGWTASYEGGVLRISNGPFVSPPAPPAPAAAAATEPRPQPPATSQ